MRKRSVTPGQLFADKSGPRPAVRNIRESNKGL